MALVDRITLVVQAIAGEVRPLQITRANLDAAATGGTIIPNRVYRITDENRLAVGATTTTYAACLKEGEGGSGGGGNVSVSQAGVLTWNDGTTDQNLDLIVLQQVSANSIFFRDPA